MARPSKQQESADLRIRNAFWKILEEHEYKDITVGMIVDEAQCNRGSFYYHYPNIEALVDCVINEELLGNFTITQVIFSVASGFKLKDSDRDLITQQIKNLWLIAERGGLDLIDPKIKSGVIRMWTSILCPNGEELNPSTYALLEYTSSGIMGLMMGLQRQGISAEDTYYLLPDKLMLDISRFAILHISRYQGISEEEIILRLQTVNNYILTSKK